MTALLEYVCCQRQGNRENESRSKLSDTVDGTSNVALHYVQGY
jgi:hypothetical protein